MAPEEGNLSPMTLWFDRERRDWVLVDDDSDRVVSRFASKSDALGGRLADLATARGGASVKIQRENGTFEEERTYPRAKDPRKSPG